MFFTWYEQSKWMQHVHGLKKFQGFVLTPFLTLQDDSVWTMLCIHDPFIFCWSDGVTRNEPLNQTFSSKSSVSRGLSALTSPLRARHPFSWQIEMNCVKEVRWVALGTPLRGVAVRLVTLSPGVRNNRWNQLLWESVWLGGGAVWLLGSGRTPAYVSSLTVYHSAAMQSCITRSPYVTPSAMKFIDGVGLMDRTETYKLWILRLGLRLGSEFTELVWTQVSLAHFRP